MMFDENFYEKILAAYSADAAATEYAKVYKVKGTIPKMDIHKVIFNNPYVIVIWSDKTKTIVKAKDEIYDPEKGLAMAIAKKALGNKGSYYETFKKWLSTTPCCENCKFRDSYSCDSPCCDCDDFSEYAHNKNR